MLLLGRVPKIQLILALPFVEYWIKIHGNEPGLPGLPFSPKQLFWLSLARRSCMKHSPKYLFPAVTHPPSDIRVNAMAKNTPEFSKDFNCRPGTNMNPQKKCMVW